MEEQHKGADAGQGLVEEQGEGHEGVDSGAGHAEQQDDEVDWRDDTGGGAAEPAAGEDSAIQENASRTPLLPCILWRRRSFVKDVQRGSPRWKVDPRLLKAMQCGQA